MLGDPDEACDVAQETFFQKKENKMKKNKSFIPGGSNRMVG
jgi:DNA-directed RNA polymerase specialized sigma24 family protein